MKLYDVLDPERPAPWALVIFRVAIGVVMMAHGWQKLQDPGAFAETLAGKDLPMPLVLTYLAIAGELGGGALLALGLLTPVGGFAIAATMAVAISEFHAGNGLFAGNGGWELPGVLMVAGIFFMFRGGGRYSLDALIARRRRKGDRPESEARTRRGPPSRPRHAAA